MAQFGRPISDVSTGSWTTTPLYSDIDEASASETDYVSSSADPSSDTFEVALTSSLSDPASSSSHTFRFRHELTESGGGSGTTNDLTVSLIENTTVIASTTVNPVKNVWNSASYTLTSGEADNITDYTDLRLRFVANKTGGGKASTLHISWAEFEVPDAVAAYSLTLAQGSYTLSGQATGLEADRTLPLAQGSYTKTGQTTGLLADRTLELAQGSYTLSGQVLSFNKGFALALAQGPYKVSGQENGIQQDRTK